MNSGAEKTKRFFQHPAVYWTYLCLGGLATTDAIHELATHQGQEGVAGLGVGLTFLAWGFECKHSASGGKRPWVSAMWVLAALLIFGDMAISKFG